MGGGWAEFVPFLPETLFALDIFGPSRLIFLPERGSGIGDGFSTGVAWSFFFLPSSSFILFHLLYAISLQRLPSTNTIILNEFASLYIVYIVLEIFLHVPLSLL